MSDPENDLPRLIVTDRLCLEDLADDAVICLRRIDGTEGEAMILQQRTGAGDLLFCVESPFTRGLLRETRLLTPVSFLAELAQCLPIRSSDTILTVGSADHRLYFRQVSIELDWLSVPPELLAEVSRQDVAH
jgi:hypothetical protein